MHITFVFYTLCWFSLPFGGALSLRRPTYARVCALIPTFKTVGVSLVCQGACYFGPIACLSLPGRGRDLGGESFPPFLCRTQGHAKKVFGDESFSILSRSIHSWRLFCFMIQKEGVWGVAVTVQTQN